VSALNVPRLLPKYYYDDQTKERVMGEPYSTHEREEHYIQCFDRKTCKKDRLQVSMDRSEGNIKIYLKEIVWERVELKDGLGLCALVNTIKK
jgi:hypothetical protein